MNKGNWAPCASCDDDRHLIKSPWRNMFLIYPESSHTQLTWSGEEERVKNPNPTRWSQLEIGIPFLLLPLFMIWPNWKERMSDWIRRVKMMPNFCGDIQARIRPLMSSWSLVSCPPRLKGERIGNWSNWADGHRDRRQRSVRSRIKRVCTDWLIVVGSGELPLKHGN